MKFLSSRRGIAVIAALLIALFLFRPGVFGLRSRISKSIGNALARRVTIDNVRLQALPRPGFDLEGLVIYDDPAFSAEPMIRAQDVFASIRLRSLLRGRLEIATLSASDPSINIVRSDAGQWNLASLLERNAQIPAAPTRKPTSERRPAFPYLEATSARINFKIGAEKKSYALVDADVALWQESENSWGARLKAQPVRTDFNLTDTGQVRVDAIWQRAPSLHVTPMRVTIAWQKGQLGQITTLLTGKDRGWRGGVDLSASLSGTPEDLAIESTGAIQNFHRYDILDDRNVHLATHCTGRYNVSGGSISGLLCESPVGDGTLQLSGDVVTRNSPRPYDLTLVAKQLPITALVALAHQSKQRLPRDLTGEGNLDAEFHAARDSSGATKFSGTGEAKGVWLRSNDQKHAVDLGNIPLAIAASSVSSGVTNRVTSRVANRVTNNVTSNACCTQNPAGKGQRVRAHRDPSAAPEEPRLRIGPASMAVSVSTPVSVGGWISATGYNFFLRGDLSLKNLFGLENTLGIPALQPAATGAARLDMTVSGSWKGLAGPSALGTATLRNVLAEMHALNVPIEIASATVTLRDNDLSVHKLLAQIGKTHWTGSLQSPRHCAPDCKYQFDLSADKLSASDLVEWFAAQPAARPWYSALVSNDKARASSLLALQARGTLHVGQFEMKKAVANDVTTEFTANRGKLTLEDLRAQFLAGTHQGTWTIDANAQPVEYRGSGTLHNVSLDRLGELMKDDWISGKADGSYEIKASGTDFNQMLENADGKLEFAMRNGVFTHIKLPDALGPLPVRRFSGSLHLAQGAWQISAGRIESHDGVYQVTGTASPAHGLDFLLSRGVTSEDDQSWNITGSLIRPHVEESSEEVSRSETDSKNGDKR